MPNLFGQSVKRADLVQSLGSVAQVGGMRRVDLAEGPGKGAGVVEVRTGAGFEFDVLLDRGLDISRAWYMGASLAWHASPGDGHPNRFDDKGLGWLRTFPGGMLATCGLTYMGAPCKDGDAELALHGRYTSLPASSVSLTEGWEGEDYVMRLSGVMREAVVFGENLVLKREIETRLGVPGLILRDQVTNEGFRTTPHQILYHCNFGYPLVSEFSVLDAPATKVDPRDAEAAKGAEDACRFAPPQAGYAEKCYFHHLTADSQGMANVRLRNPKLLGGLAICLRYSLSQLPYFTQWKMIGQQEYVCGLEPGSGYPLGRAEERKAGRLILLEPGETRNYEIEFLVEQG